MAHSLSTPKTSDHILQITDSLNCTYQCLLKDVIGKGGQGVVFKVKESTDFAVKLALTKDSTNAHSLDGFNLDKDPDGQKRKQWQHILSLPIDPDLHISLPFSYINEYAGYIMRYLGEMSSINAMTVQQSTKLLITTPIDPCFNHLFDPNDAKNGAKYACQFLSFYKQQGSLRLRLNLLKQLAFILGKLHEQDLVFGDLSPNNVLKTNALDQQQFPQVWLIDIDNIRTMGDGTASYTGEYGAPEIVNGQGKGSTIFSDCYSFAVIAFRLLTHDEPIQQQWIDDAESSVGSSHKIFHKLLLTTELLSLFDATFTAPKPSRRPPIWSWLAAIQRAENLTITCPHCGLHHYFDPQSQGNKTALKCPYCDSEMGLILTAASTAPNNAANAINATNEAKATNAAAELPIHWAHELNQHHATTMYRSLWENTRADQDAVVCSFNLDHQQPENVELQVRHKLKLQVAQSEQIIDKNHSLRLSLDSLKSGLSIQLINDHTQPSTNLFVQGVSSC